MSTTLKEAVPVDTGNTPDRDREPPAKANKPRGRKPAQGKPATTAKPTSARAKKLEDQAAAAAKLARNREARHRRRLARLMADPTIDPERLRLYRDRELWDLEAISNFLDVITQRVQKLRSDARERPHQAELHPKYPPLTPDAMVRHSSGQMVPAYEAGRIREWAVKSGRMKFNPVTKQIVHPDTSPRHGSPHGRLPAKETE